MPTSAAIKAALKALPANAPAGLRTFLTEFFSRVSPDDIKLLHPEQIADIAVRHWEMTKGRKPGEPLVAIRTVTGGAGHTNRSRTLIDIVNDDMAFLVDSVAAEITRQRRLIRLLLHPILHAKLDKRGTIESITGKSAAGAQAQSHMHIELQGAMSQNLIPALTADLTRVLREVGFATRDWMAMRERLRAAQKELGDTSKSIAGADRDEFMAFLDYLYRDNFTLLGFREYKFSEKAGKLTSQTVKGSSLGLLRDEAEPVFLSENGQGLPHDLQIMRRSMPPLVISKVNRRSPVHRPVPMDAIAVKRFDKNGKVVGEYLFLGLLTSVTYSRSIQDVPLLRQKADTVLMRSGFLPGSHNFKALRHILEKYPRDELCQIDANELEKVSLSLLRLQERHRIALYARKDPFHRYISCLVYIPRDRYGSRMRMLIQRILEREMNGRCSDIQTNLDDSMMARVIYRVEIDQTTAPKINAARIEAMLQEAGRAWRDRIANALQDAGHDDRDIPEIAHLYADAFPESYRESYEPKQAVHDIALIETAMGSGRLTLALYRDKSCGSNNLKLKAYQVGAPVILSDMLPVLENMGLRVLSELPFEVRKLGAAQPVWIHDFMLSTTASLPDAQLAKATPKFEDALGRLWRGELENDQLNQLVLAAGMDWREIMILRTYVRYLKQTRSPFSTQYVERTLCRHAGIARQLVDLFLALFNPAQQKKADTAAARLRDNVETALAGVTSLDEDRILRSLLGLINATVRTNFFQPAADGGAKPYLAIKLDSKKIDDIPEPKPYREIWVYSPRVEGVHLRADVIARGGIRWSDRNEDFRTEILGLMKAQQVKNSIIVPMGAKGGFIVKRPPPDRAAFQTEGIECYKLFIRALLEITDNRKGTTIIPPTNTVRRDGDDPYLVVAADKGTATFSDIANALSLEFGFWLGDAFASGGSAGYDHKKMGITARGAWESVKRHFREMGVDTQTQPFDVMGVGDMAGDVYGNGLLMSEKIRLIGTFNHIHIFCDPNPDPASSFKERKRLFDAVKGWDAYDTKLLSKGGRIFTRTEKSLTLTPEIRTRFGIEKDKVAPNELIQAMLRMPCDLLYFGGIGTYVKASSESHADVGDKINDSLRINANEIRAKVLGEGANLAVTQSARIEYAKKGGRLNADFIDNSGGVNCSDVEVNIKILLGDVAQNPKNDLPTPKRNTLLARMTDEVAALVLRNNYQQTQGISLMESLSAEQLPRHARLIEELERNHGFNRKQSGVPDVEEMDVRAKAAKGLTRPELAILQAHAKIVDTRALLASDVPDMPEMEGRWLFSYFPVPLRLKYETEIRRHRLRREIIATQLISDIVNRMGPVFIRGLMDKTGAPVGDIVRAFEAVRAAFELDLLWAQVEALDNKVTAAIQLRAMQAIALMAERETLWFLTRLGRRLDLSQDVKRFQEGIASLRGLMDSVVTPDVAAVISQRLTLGTREGLPPELAYRLAAIAPLGAACDITRIAHETKTDLAATAKVYFQLGEKFHLHWLRQQARLLPANDRWSGEAAASLIEAFYGMQASLTVKVLQDMKVAKDKKAAGNLVDRWLGEYSKDAAQTAPFFADLRAAPRIELPMLMLAAQRLRQVAA